MLTVQEKIWTQQVIQEKEIKKYLIQGKDFIDEQIIKSKLATAQITDKKNLKIF